MLARLLIVACSCASGCSLDGHAIAPSGGGADAAPDTAVRSDSSPPADAGGDDSSRVDAPVADCAPSTTTCTGDVLVVCDDGGRISEMRPCALGCSVSDPTRCARLVPSNVAADGLGASSEDVRVDDAREIDTTACDFTGLGTVSLAAQGAGGGDVCLMSVGSLVIGDGGSLTASGSRPLVILAERTVTIDGTLDVSARGVRPGAGGSAGGPASIGPGEGDGGGGEGLHSGTYRDGGGGGGGACGRGGDGGDGGSGSARGGAGGSAFLAATELVPLVGGSGGGTGPGTVSLMLAGRGGAGGGALQISAAQSVTITGEILAGGGGGRGGRYDNCSGNWGSGGGGGAGGAVLLEAPTVTFSGGGVFTSGGGGGGASESATCTGSDGRNGQDGAETRDRAAGGTTTGGRGGVGGRSGGGGILDGEAGQTYGGDGGGGGGGAGCILIRNADGAMPGGADGFSPNLTPGLRTLSVARD